MPYLVTGLDEQMMSTESFIKLILNLFLSLNSDTTIDHQLHLLLMARAFLIIKKMMAAYFPAENTDKKIQIRSSHEVGFE